MYYFTSPTSTISSVSSMSSTSSSSRPIEMRPRTASSSLGSSAFSAWPYKSSHINATSSEEPTSYLSDEDLCFSSEEDAIPPPEVELSTEEQIELMRRAAEQQTAQRPWHQQPASERRPSKPFPEEPKKKTRPSTRRRKSTKKVVFASPAAV